ncbi:MAG TPA: pentapeptide repeat-containing protein [Pyrinomonadaceae bacterium]|nr:pentapeptide repeat-containing protein [Pyrinomonadaceae bacterium]
MKIAPHCCDIFGRRIKHDIDLGDRTAPLFPADLRGVDLTNKNSRGADLQSANLEDAILTGADLREANLRGANLRNANLTYSNLWGADLQDTNCDGTKSVDRSKNEGDRNTSRFRRAGGSNVRSILSNRRNSMKRW